MHRTNSAGKREQIIAAAKTVVIREGIWNTTTRKIAEEASITLASIHYHFENKEALLLAVFEEMLDSIMGAAFEYFARASSLAQRIEHALLLTWEYSEGHGSEQFLLFELTVYALRTEGSAWLARRQIDGFLAFYMEIFRKASDLTGLQDIDIEGLTRMIVAGVDGILLQHYADPDLARAREAIRKLIFLAQQYPLTDAEPPLTARSLSREKR
jgi:AcrR family transcriptional regulator